jgi:hypothetical protein
VWENLPKGLSQIVLSKKRVIRNELKLEVIPRKKEDFSYTKRGAK